MSEEYMFRTFSMNPENRTAVVVDIDGTVALMNGRSPYDYSKVSTDVPNDPVVRLVRRLARDHQIVFMSGRKAVCYEDTISWLNQYVGVAYDGPYMRKHGDRRHDTIIKHELFTKHVEPRYNVEFVLEDRARVVQMWRESGLTCLQVAEGDF